MNAPTLRSLPELLAHLGASDIREADAEYWRMVDNFRDSPTARRLWHPRHWEKVKSIATGITTAEAELLDGAYWLDQDSYIDHDELARAERRRNFQTMLGSHICGGCGGIFDDIGALMAHESYCNFQPDANAAPMIRK